MKKLNETGRIGIGIAITIIFIVWGIYISYLLEPLKDLYFPMALTGILISIALCVYWIYQLEEP